MAKTVGSLAKHLAKQKLTAGQFVMQSGCLSFELGQHGISGDIAAIASLSIRTWPAFAGATKAANIVAATNSPRTNTFVRSRNLMAPVLTYRQILQKGENCGCLTGSKQNRCFVISPLASQHTAQDVVAAIEMMPSAPATWISAKASSAQLSKRWTDATRKLRYIATVPVNGKSSRRTYNAV